MIRLLATMTCLCFFIIGCTTTMTQYNTYVEQELSTDQWLKSPEAKKGYIYISGMINPMTASSVVKKIIELNNRDDIERIRIVINTPGGEAASHRAIINGINMSKKVVDIINIGTCSSAGVGIYASVSGKRYAFPNTNFMIHRPNPNDWQAGVEEGLKFEVEQYENILKKNANLPEKWFPLTDRLIFFSEKEAKEYNLVDEIITELP